MTITPYFLEVLMYFWGFQNYVQIVCTKTTDTVITNLLGIIQITQLSCIIFISYDFSRLFLCAMAATAEFILHYKCNCFQIKYANITQILLPCFIFFIHLHYGVKGNWSENLKITDHWEDLSMGGMFMKFILTLRC